MCGEMGGGGQWVPFRLKKGKFTENSTDAHCLKGDTHKYVVVVVAVVRRQPAPLTTTTKKRLLFGNGRAQPRVLKECALRSH